MKRILTIDKCQDCNIENCKLRTMCGTIPNECPLDILVEEREFPNWDDAPEWANWLTCNRDGWYWWKGEPYIHSESPTKADFPIPENTTREIYSRPESHKEVSE